jgi:hypothetical protein
MVVIVMKDNIPSELILLTRSKLWCKCKYRQHCPTIARSGAISIPNPNMPSNLVKMEGVPSPRFPLVYWTLLLLVENTSGHSGGTR